MDLKSMQIAEPIPVSDEAVLDAEMDNELYYQVKDISAQASKPQDASPVSSETTAGSATASRKREKLSRTLKSLYQIDPDDDLLDLLKGAQFSCENRKITCKRGMGVLFEHNQATGHLGASRQLPPRKAAELLVQMTAINGYADVELTGPPEFKQAFLDVLNERGIDSVTVRNFPLTEQDFKYLEKRGEAPGQEDLPRDTEIVENDSFVDTHDEAPEDSFSGDSPTY